MLLQMFLLWNLLKEKEKEEDEHTESLKKVFDSVMC
jgi:hypothetical protein